MLHDTNTGYEKRSQHMGKTEGKLRKGWDVVQLVRASDRHAADAGSIPRCGKGFFSQSTFSADSLTVSITLVRNRMHLHLCAR